MSKCQNLSYVVNKKLKILFYRYIFQFSFEDCVLIVKISELLKVIQDLLNDENCYFLAIQSSDTVSVTIIQR